MNMRDVPIGQCVYLVLRYGGSRFCRKPTDRGRRFCTEHEPVMACLGKLNGPRADTDVSTEAIDRWLDWKTAQPEGSA